MESNKEKLPLSEMILLLEKNMFEKIEEDDEERLENFLTPFQIRLRLKVPVENAEFGVALQYLGLKGYYKGHNIPFNPDNTAFTVKTNKDGESYLQTLVRKSMLEEIEDFIEKDEMFNEYMRKQCEQDAKDFLSNEDFINFSMLTSGPSEFFSHIITIAATEISKGLKTDRKSHIFIDHKLNDEDLLDYITPYKEGVKSSYERTGIALPGMDECLDSSIFTPSLDALRTYYKICNNKNVIVDDPVSIKNFISKWLEKNNLDESYNINEISSSYISIRRVSKYFFNEYYNLYDLGLHLKYNKLKQRGSIGESELLSDIIPLLKDKIINIKQEEE